MNRATAWSLAGLLLLGACATTDVPVVPPPIESFGNWRPTPGRAHYLACPQNYCLNPDFATVLKPVPAATLRDAIRLRLDAMPKAQLLSVANEGLRLVYRQSDPAQGGAATITVEIVDADEGLSGIAVYTEAAGRPSYALQERDRAWRWLNAIDEVSGKPQAASGHKS